MPTAPDRAAASELKARNRRTAFILLSIALVFFVGIIAAQLLGGPASGIGVTGSVILLFLVLAIGRNLRGKR
jgi:uncharacterized membrane protein (DUF485 family)